MSGWFLTFVIFLGAIGPAGADEKQTSDEVVRKAIERSLPFLLEGGEAWREGRADGGQNKRVCVTCHQIPFTIWSHNEAGVKGIKFDRKRLDDLTAWSLDWCAEQKHPKTQTHTGGFLSTMQQMSMGRSPHKPSAKALGVYELFGKVIGSMQKEEGWWKEGNQIRGKAGEREADEVDTMWIILGLDSLEKLKLPDAALKAAAHDRKRGMDWLKGSQPGTRTDWLALRMLLDREFGDPKQGETWKKQLLAQQNGDGGWPLLKGELSHPLVTGQALWALSMEGNSNNAAAIDRGRKFLVNTQAKDGSWKATSRNNPSHTNVVTIHWGTGWATIGLVRTLLEQAK